MTNLSSTTLSMLVASAVLVGCAKKPPACSDAESLDKLRGIVIEQIRKPPDASLEAVMRGDTQKMLQAAMADLLRDDPKNIQAGYIKDLKLELAKVVSDGYNEQARKNSCRAHLTISTANGRQFSRDVGYTTQVSESKNQDFVLEAQSFQPFVDAVMADMMTFYSARRLQGQWSGTYECGGINGATSGPQGPYQMPVAVTVDGQFRAKLERTTRGGGTEVLNGTFDQYGGALELRGQGQNSSDDIWLTEFKGAVKGLELKAAGQVATQEGRLLRRCAMNLAAAPK